MSLNEDGVAALRRIVDVSRETAEAFSLYDDLLQRWSPRINLVAPSTLRETWTRHFADSAQIYALAPPDAAAWIDLGAGAGFPGLAAALLAKGAGRPLQVALVESDTRKAAFLATVIRELALPATVIPTRIEAAPARRYDVVSARALAPLPRLLELARPFCGPGSVCLFPKGATANDELTRAREAWHIEVVEHPSRTDPRAVILEVQEFRRVHPQKG